MLMVRMILILPSAKQTNSQVRVQSVMAVSESKGSTTLVVGLALIGLGLSNLGEIKGRNLND